MASTYLCFGLILCNTKSALRSESIQYLFVFN